MYVLIIKMDRNLWSILFLVVAKDFTHVILSFVYLHAYLSYLNKNCGISVLLIFLEIFISCSIYLNFTIKNVVLKTTAYAYANV